MDDLQGEAVLTVRIATEESVELKDLTDSLQAFEAQYRRTQEHLFPERDVSESVLIVKDVRSGSIIFDLIPILAPIIQEVEQIKSIVDYVDTFRTKVLPWLQPGGRNPDATTAELSSFHKTVAAVAKDRNGKLDIKARYVKSNGAGEEVRSEFSITSEEARTIRQNIQSEQIERRLPSQDDYKQVVMSLHQASLDEAKAGKAAGEKGVIESISDRPLKLVYASELAGQRIKSELRQDDNPLKKAFTVDVNVELFKGKPHAYRITHVHSVDPVE